jgi:plasmid stabilization system protein ParE
MKVRYTVPAQADLDEIYAYVSDKNPSAAERIKGPNQD